MSDRVFELPTVGSIDSTAVTHFLGMTSTGTIKWVNADSMMVFRGVIPTKVNISIDDTALPMGFYSIDGSGLGTFPEKTVGAAMLINWKPSNVSRTQIYVSYWTRKMFVRRRHSNIWEEWSEIQTLSPS